MAHTRNCLWLFLPALCLALVVVVLVSLGLAALVHVRSHENAHSVPTKRLPRDILPVRYGLSLTPNMAFSQPPFPVKGKVIIDIIPQRPTSRIVLNSHGPKFATEDVAIHSSNATRPEDVPVVKGVTFDAENEFVYIDVLRNLSAGTVYYLSIAFINSADTDKYGLFAAPYLDTKRKLKYLIATQLQPIGARRLMPCFDEVDMKAYFDVTITRKEDQFALSNGKRTLSTPVGDGVTDHFKRTPKMSIYLLALVVGDLKFLKSPTSDKTHYEVQTVATERLVPYIEHPNKYYTAPLQAWLENVTNIPFEMDKTDHVVVQTLIGAMENWGLITYSDSILPVSMETSPAEAKLESALAIAHELAHQWYGNLVTCSWWTHLWVQEGLASYYEFQPLTALGWDGDALQQSQTIQRHLLADQTNMTTPVKIQIDTPQDAKNAFSRSTYSKGAALMRMVEGVLSKSVLEEALRKYLHKFKYSVVQSDDLLNALSDEARKNGITHPDTSPINFKHFLDPWLDQKGFPLVKVLSNTNGRASISQSRYLSPRNQSESEPSKYGYKWDVPITVVDAQTKPSSAPKGPDHWLKIKDAVLTIEIAKGDAYWFIINPDQMYFYRVWYDERLRKVHSKSLMQMSAASRAHILDDSFSLARSGYYSVETALDNTLMLGSERYQPSWAAVLRFLSDIEPFFRTQKWFPRLRAHFTKQASSVIDRIGDAFKPNEPIELEMLRKDLLGLLVWFGDKKYNEDALRKFSIYFDNPRANPVNANEMSTVACVGVKEGNSTVFDMVKAEYDHRRLSPITEERTSLAFAMTCSPRQQDLQFIFNCLVGKTVFFKPEDIYKTAEYLSSTPGGEEILWKFMEENWHKAQQIVLSMLFRKITSNWHTVEELHKLKAFISEKKDATGLQREMFSEVVIKVEQNIQFVKDNSKVFEEWLDKEYGKATNLTDTLTEPSLRPLAAIQTHQGSSGFKNTLSASQGNMVHLTSGHFPAFAKFGQVRRSNGKEDYHGNENGWRM